MRQSVIHIVNPLRALHGGSEQRAVHLYEALAERLPTQLWCTNQPDPDLAAKYPMKQIVTRALRFPRGGTLVFVGIYFKPGRWTWLARPRRAILIYNTPNKDWLEERVADLTRAFGFAPELRFASEALRATSGRDGPVELSLFDLNRFRPAASVPVRPFTVGRLSRPDAYKHHPDDAALYRRLARQGMRVRVMGAPQSMEAALHDEPGVELIPAKAIDAADFLRSLDCFYYRTDPSWIEPSGRVIAEAMACGLPLVCGREGGYAELVQEAQGFLIGDSASAEAALMTLQNSPDLRDHLALRGRSLISERFSRVNQEALVRSYADAVG